MIVIIAWRRLYMIVMINNRSAQIISEREQVMHAKPVTIDLSRERPSSVRLNTGLSLSSIDPRSVARTSYSSLQGGSSSV